MHCSPIKPLTGSWIFLTVDATMSFTVFEMHAEVRLSILIAVELESKLRELDSAVLTDIEVA